MPAHQTHRHEAAHNRAKGQQMDFKHVLLEQSLTQHISLGTHHQAHALDMPGSSMLSPSTTPAGHRAPPWVCHPSSLRESRLWCPWGVPHPFFPRF